MKTLFTIVIALSVLMIFPAKASNLIVVHRPDIPVRYTIPQLQTTDTSRSSMDMEPFFCAAPLGFLHGIGLEMGRTQYGLSSRSYPQIKAALEEIDILIGGQIF